MGQVAHIIRCCHNKFMSVGNFDPSSHPHRNGKTSLPSHFFSSPRQIDLGLNGPGAKNFCYVASQCCAWFHLQPEGIHFGFQFSLHLGVFPKRSIISRCWSFVYQWLCSRPLMSLQGRGTVENWLSCARDRQVMVWMALVNKLSVCCFMVLCVIPLTARRHTFFVSPCNLACFWRAQSFPDADGLSTHDCGRVVLCPFGGGGW